MNNQTIRLLRADEIECRVSAINERGLALLLFKDARVDQKILDETFTAFGWRRSHQSIEGNLYCTVEVWDREKQQWIGKQDVGTMSYSEKEKGQASDSFKRACFNWGIGRELYTAPFIWLPADRVRIQLKGDRYTTSEQFRVSSIAYNENREIISLEIRNARNETVYLLQGSKDPAKEVKAALSKKAAKKEPQKEIQNEAQSAPKEGGLLPEELRMERDRTGVSLETVLGRYGLLEVSQMTPEIYEKALRSLRNSKAKKAA